MSDDEPDPDEAGIEERDEVFMGNVRDLCFVRGNLKRIKERFKQFKTRHAENFRINTTDKTCEDLSLLGWVASLGQLEYIEYLFQNKASPYIEDSFSLNPLHFAIAGNVTYNMGYDPDQTPDTAMAAVAMIIQHAELCERKQANVVAQLPETKRNRIPKPLPKLWNRTDCWKRTPLDYCVMKHQTGVLKFLILKGAKINGPLFTSQYGEILDGRRGTNNPDHKPDHKPDTMDAFNGRSDEILYTRFGTSLLHQAIEFHNHKAVDLLIKDGAHRHVYNSKGETPLICAVNCTNVEAVRMLTESENFDASQTYGRVFNFLREVGSENQLVCQSERRPEDSRDGWNALHCLASNSEDTDEDNEIMRLLLYTHMDVRVQTAARETALEIARRRGVASLVDELIVWEHESAWSPEELKKRRDALTMSQYNIHDNNDDNNDDNNHRSNSSIYDFPPELFGLILNREDLQTNPNAT